MLIDIYDEDGAVMATINSSFVFEVGIVRFYRTTGFEGRKFDIYYFDIVFTENSGDPETDFKYGGKSHKSINFDIKKDANESRARFISDFNEAEKQKGDKLCL